MNKNENKLARQKIRQKTKELNKMHILDKIKKLVKSIKDYLEDYDKELDEFMDKLLNKMTYAEIRDSYDHHLESDKQSSTKINEQIDQCIQELMECKSLLNKNILPKCEDIGSLMNQARIGTLQGLTRQVITQSAINVHPEDIAVNYELKREYLER